MCRVPVRSVEDTNSIATIWFRGQRTETADETTLIVDLVVDVSSEFCERSSLTDLEFRSRRHSYCLFVVSLDIAVKLPSLSTVSKADASQKSRLRMHLTRKVPQHGGAQGPQVSAAWLTRDCYSNKYFDSNCCFFLISAVSRFFHLYVSQVFVWNFYGPVYNTTLEYPCGSRCSQIQCSKGVDILAGQMDEAPPNERDTPSSRPRRRILSCNSCRRLKSRCEYDPRLNSCRRCHKLR